MSQEWPREVDGLSVAAVGDAEAQATEHLVREPDLVAIDRPRPARLRLAEEDHVEVALEQLVESVEDGDPVGRDDLRDERDADHARAERPRTLPTTKTRRPRPSSATQT